MLVLRHIAIAVLAIVFGLFGPQVNRANLWAQQPLPPGLSFIQTLGLQAGVDTEVRLDGQRLVGTGKVSLSAAASNMAITDFAASSQSETFTTCRMLLPANVPLGILGVRYAGGTGVSNLRLMLVDDLPTLQFPGRQRTLATALPITLPIAVEGHCEPETASYFNFTAQADQRISLEVFARRLASPLDPILRVLAADGTELAYRDDEPGLMGDCRMSFQAPQTGEYYLELRDIRFAGGANYRFRLRLGSFPLASVVFPPVVKRGVATDVVACVTEGEAAPAKPITIPADDTSEFCSFGVSGLDQPAGGSAILQVLASDLPQSLEREPNDAAEQATDVAIPGGLSGRFGQPRDKDSYTFKAQAGEQLQLHAYTQTVGSPATIVLKLYSADGKLIVATDPAINGEPRLDVTLPATGKYRLLVEELHRRGGEAFVYHLVLQTQSVGYTLDIDRDRINPPQQGVCSIKVNARRTHYAGPITLGLRNAPAGTVLKDNALVAGQFETVLKIQLPPDAAAGSLFTTHVVGTSELNGKPFEVLATSSAALQEDLRWSASVPNRFSQQLALGIGPKFPDFYKLTLEPAECVLPRLVGTASWMVKAERLHNFSDAITLELKGLPAGVTATGTTIEKGRNDTTIMLAGGEALPVGASPIELLATAVMQDQPQTFALNGTLLVIPPLRVALAMAGLLAPGGKQKLTITIERFGKENHPVQIALQNLPVGVTAPAEIVIPTGTNTLEIELNAAATASPGKIENLSAQATTKFLEQDVQSVSPLTVLEVVNGN